MVMKDPRMTPVSQGQPGFKNLKRGARRKSERRSTVAHGSHRRQGRHAGSKY